MQAATTYTYIVTRTQIYLSVLRALQKSAGSWQRRTGGAAWVERLRPGRLARLHARRPA
jgi:hypothetical protein